MMSQGFTFDHDDGRYRGTLNLWARLVAEAVIGHVHSCPECFEHVPCDDPRCTLEPDLERNDGTPAGSHCVCDSCRKAGHSD